MVIAEKRHHIRFFPPQGSAADKNGNPVPGVIVDRDVTHPFDNDVYLCSHAAIQGTARPTHYSIIMDEMNVDVDKFQAMLYEHCYQYQRATTPVSLCKSIETHEGVDNANGLQFLLSTMPTWLPSVENLTSTWRLPRRLL